MACFGSEEDRTAFAAGAPFAFLDTDALLKLFFGLPSHAMQDPDAAIADVRGGEHTSAVKWRGSRVRGH